jgi:DNA excision repair protein ERCC-2
MALTLSKLFMRTISQNPNENQTGVSLWTLEDIHKAQAKERDLLEAERQRKAAEEDEFGDGDFPDDMLVDLDI